MEMNCGTKMTAEGLLTECDMCKVDIGIDSDKCESEDGKIVRFDHNMTSCLIIKVSLVNIPQCLPKSCYNNNTYISEYAAMAENEIKAIMNGTDCDYSYESVGSGAAILGSSSIASIRFGIYLAALFTILW